MTPGHRAALPAGYTRTIERRPAASRRVGIDAPRIGRLYACDVAGRQFASIAVRRKSMTGIQVVRFAASSHDQDDAVSVRCTPKRFSARVRHGLQASSTSIKTRRLAATADRRVDGLRADRPTPARGLLATASMRSWCATLEDLTRKAPRRVTRPCRRPCRSRIKRSCDSRPGLRASARAGLRRAISWRLR